ncbi:MAG: AMP-binding protein [Methylobacteriaceae bacterium]|nr:AMP-binding protein [Methylobacteriaceae bacterium]
MSAAPDIAAAGRLTVYGLFRARALRDPQALAVEAGARRLSYAELDARVRALAGGLAARGVGRGDRIAILSENRVEYVELELAAALLGAIVACQNWRLSGEELAHCLRLVTPRLLIVSARHAAAGRAAAPADLPVVEIERDFGRLLAAPLSDDPAVDPEDGLVILYTSGTTGLPKGALISHRAQIARMIALRLDLRATEEDGFIAWSPLFHMAATDQTLGALMSGATVVVIDGFDVEAILSALERHKVGWLVLMPGAIEPVIARLRERPIEPRGIRAMGAMADLVPIAQIAEVTALLGAPFLNSFGATETGLPPCSAALIEPGVAPARLSKRHSALCAIRLLDETGADVAPGEAGEMAVRGPTVFSGYWAAEATNRRDFADGWFRMGDLFRRNADGGYDFVDRAKYMIKSGGENIYPAEIERVLLADPRIADAAIVRKRDLVWGETPVAFVAAKAPGLTEEDVRAICRDKLASYKRPREVRLIALEAFPRSTTGKIQRHEMETWL